MDYASSHLASRNLSRLPVKCCSQLRAPVAYASGAHIFAVTRIHVSLGISGWWFTPQPQVSDRCERRLRVLISSSLSCLRDRSGDLQASELKLEVRNLRFVGGKIHPSELLFIPLFLW